MYGHVFARHECDAQCNYSAVSSATFQMQIQPQNLIAA